MEPWLSPCLDAEQMRAVDGWAIEQQGVPSLELMEAAGRAVAAAAAEAAGDREISVSLTHSRETAAAVALAQR